MVMYMYMVNPCRALEKKTEEANNPSEARWRDVQSHCHAWQAREHKIKAAMATEFGQQWETTSKTCRHDLDPESSITILFDNVSPRYSRFDGSAFQEFRAHLFRHLASKLPCVGFQTGSVVQEAIRSNRLAVSRENFVVFRTVICIGLAFEISCRLGAALARDHYLTQNPQKYFIFFNVFLWSLKAL